MAIPKSAKFKYEIVQDYKVPNGKAGNFSAGKPTWVVVHSSGNPNAGIDSEIAYMANNQDYAFTHAWAGHNKIVEIANTDYRAWGAGSTANKYAVQIEVTEDKRLTKAQKLQAIDREAFWVAVQCAYYGIPMNRVYSHNDISNMYPKETNHTDPIAYFKSVGVTWSEFKAQVKKYHDILAAGGDTSKVTTLGATATSTISNMFKKGDIVELKPIATHWIKFYEKVGGTNKGRTYISTDLKDAQFKVTYLNSDGTIELAETLNNKARYVAYERDLVKAELRLYTVQTGAYSNINNAKKQADKLMKDGYDTIVTKK